MPQFPYFGSLKASEIQIKTLREILLSTFLTSTLFFSHPGYFWGGLSWFAFREVALHIYRYRTKSKSFEWQNKMAGGKVCEVSSPSFAPWYFPAVFSTRSWLTFATWSFSQRFLTSSVLLSVANKWWRESLSFFSVLLSKRFPLQGRNLKQNKDGRFLFHPQQQGLWGKEHVNKPVWWADRSAKWEVAYANLRRGPSPSHRSLVALWDKCCCTRVVRSTVEDFGVEWGRWTINWPPRGRIRGFLARSGNVYPPPPP